MRRRSQRLVCASWRRASRGVDGDGGGAGSCLAPQDVRGQGLQFGCPVRGGHRWPQEELREPDGQPLVDPFVQGRAALRDEVRGVEVWTTAAQLLEHRRWQGTTAIGEVDAEVLRVDGAPGRCRRGLDALAFLRGLGGRDEAGDPPVAQASGPTQRPRYLTTQPHFERLLHGRRRETGVTQLIARAIVVDDFATPQATQQGEHLLQERAALGFVDVLRQHLRCVGLAQDHDQQQPPAAEPVQIGEFTGQPHRVAPRHDQVRAEFQTLGACRGVGQPDEGIEGAIEHQLGQPERIEPQPFEVIDQPREVVERQVCLASTRESEPDLHGHTSVHAVPAYLVSAHPQHPTKSDKMFRPHYGGFCQGRQGPQEVVQLGRPEGPGRVVSADAYSIAHQEKELAWLLARTQRTPLTSQT